MTKKALSRAASAGKAAMLAVGLAVVLAVVLGLATSATAADGRPFLLGKLNVATTTSALASKGAGPALSLRVGEGKAPLVVNPGAGKAANLDADELDGQSSEDFLPASTYTEESEPTSGVDVGNGTGIRSASFACGPGDRLLGGGYRWMLNGTNIAVVGSWPSSSGDSWVVQWANTTRPDMPYTMRIYVTCADTAAPAHG